jgi:hypothetical protein
MAKLSALHKALLGIVVCLVFFAVIETVGHLVFWAWRGTTLRQHRLQQVGLQFTVYGAYEYIPGRDIDLPPEYPVRRLETDGQGFVRTGGEENHDPQALVIAVLGGSTVEGRGASGPAGTIAGQLQRILAGSPRHRSVRVINAGRCGYNAYQQFCLLSDERFWDFHPRVVIAVDGRNDAFYAISYANHGWRPNWQPYFDELTAGINEILVDGRSFMPRAWLLQWSITASVMNRLLPGRSPLVMYPQQSSPSPDVLRRSVQSYLENHELARNKCRLRQAAYHVFLQPVLLPGRRPLHPREKQAVDEWSMHYRGEFYWSSLAQWYEQAATAAKSTAYVHDLSDVLGEHSEPLYCDSCHYLDEGNRRIAERIAATLEKSGL